MREWMYKTMLLLNLALAGGEWLASLLDHFTPEGRAPQYILYKRLGPVWATLRGENLVPPRTELQPFGHPACSQSLY
jgi:hypothetical protein